MKRHIIPLSLLTVFALSLLCSCGNGTQPSRLEGQTIITTQNAATATDPDFGVTMKTQYPVYDKSCTSISLYIENNSDENIEFGTEWILEKIVGHEWRQVEFIDNLGWTQPLFTVMPAGTYIMNCSLSIFKKPLTDGTYRVVKELSDVWYAAEFTVGASPITAETPHGFLPLDKLPEDYSAEDAEADGVVVCGYDGIRNMEKIEEFFRYANKRAFRGQLRIARFTVEGDMILVDIVRETDNRIDYYYDSTRDSFGNPEITKSYYSYFTTDGDTIYISNHSEFSLYPDDRDLFPPETVTAEAVQYVAEYYTTPYGDYSKIAVYSPDGEVKAASSGGVELFFNSTGWGTVWGIKYENQEEGMNIIDLAWEDNETCMVMAEKADGTYYYEFIHVDRESMKNIKTISYTTSAYKYENYDGQIIIPE